MMNSIKLCSLVILLFTQMSSFASNNTPTRLNQVRNSLWVFGVDNSVSEAPEVVEHSLLGLADEVESDSVEQFSPEVPEELQMAIFKVES